MKIAHILDWETNLGQLIGYQDGIMAALAELKKRGHELQFFVVGDEMVVPTPLLDAIVTRDPVTKIKEYAPDVILHHADMTRPHARPLHKLGIPMAICFAGGEPLGENYAFFQHVFVESQVYKAVFDKEGISCSIAFGANTDLFKPIQQEKYFDALFPATFAAWKRHYLFANAMRGMRACAVGYMYETHEQECWQQCVDAGILVLPHVSADVLHRLYAASNTVVIPSESGGGSQRTVLEALAMNIPCIVTDSDKFDYEGVIRVEPDADSISKAVFYATAGEQVNTRDYILENWSHIRYADALEKGLKKICA